MSSLLLNVSVAVVSLVSTIVIWLLLKHQRNIKLFQKYPGYSQFFHPALATFIPTWIYKPKHLSDPAQELNSDLIRDYKLYGPIFKRIFSTRNILCICDPDFAKVISKVGLFTKSPLSDKAFSELIGDDVFNTSDETVWRRHRLLLNPGFTDSALKVVATHTVSLMRAYLDQVKKSNNRNIVDDMHDMTLHVIATAGFGYDGDMSQITKHSDIMFKNLIYYILAPGFLRRNVNAGPLKTLKGSMDYFKQVILSIIQERRAKIANGELGELNSNDILSLLLAGAEDDSEKTAEDAEELKSLKPLTNDELIADSFVMIVAGNETTAKTLVFALHSLATLPEVQKKAQAQVDEVLSGSQDPSFEDVEKLRYIELIIKESLRVNPVATAIFRRPKKDIEFKGYTIPADTGIHYSWLLTNKDPSLWPQAESFIPERFDEQSELYSKKAMAVYSPFGLGNRICLGKRFAMVEATIILAMILQRYTVKLADPSYMMETEVVLTMRPKHSFNLIFEKR